MTSAEYVERASWWSKEITRTYTRGPGDLDNAMIRVEREYGIAYATLWALRYRLPKTIDAAIFARLWSAYRHCCERQREKLAAELQATARIAGANHPACIAAAAVLGQDETTNSAPVTSEYQPLTGGAPPERVLTVTRPNPSSNDERADAET